MTTEPHSIENIQRAVEDVESGLPSNGDTDELHIVALVLRNEHGLK
jgi:hypothetical protein